MVPYIKTGISKDCFCFSLWRLVRASSFADTTYMSRVKRNLSSHMTLPGIFSYLIFTQTSQALYSLAPETAYLFNHFRLLIFVFLISPRKHTFCILCTH